MGRLSLVVVFGLAGCQLVFPLREPLPDQPGDGPSPDAFRPLLPPDGSTTCGSTPDFDTWTYATFALSDFTGLIENPTFTASDRVLFSSEGRLYETPLAGPPSELTELMLADGTSIRFPGSTPDGQMIWFIRSAVGTTPPSVGPYYAIRTDDGFVATKTDFGIVSRQLIPSNVGFYSGTARMIVSIEPNLGDRLILVELETLDGLTWTRLDTLPFSDGSAVGDLDATIAADGCFVVFRRTDAKTYVASRDSNGVFGMPVEIQALAGSFEPALDPSGLHLWSVDSSRKQIVDGTP